MSVAVNRVPHWGEIIHRARELGWSYQRMAGGFRWMKRVGHTTHYNSASPDSLWMTEVEGPLWEKAA